MRKHISVTRADITTSLSTAKGWERTAKKSGYHDIKIEQKRQPGDVFPHKWVTVYWITAEGKNNTEAAHV